MKVSAYSAAFHYYEVLGGVRVRAIWAVCLGATTVGLLAAFWLLLWWPCVSASASTSTSFSAAAASVGTSTRRTSRLAAIRFLLRLVCRALLVASFCFATPLFTVALFVPAHLALNWFTLLPALVASAIAAQRALFARSISKPPVSLFTVQYMYIACYSVICKFLITIFH